jgi:hypothetical protein
LVWRTAITRQPLMFIRKRIGYLQAKIGTQWQLVKLQTIKER